MQKCHEPVPIKLWGKNYTSLHVSLYSVREKNSLTIGFLENDVMLLLEAL